MKAFMGIDPGQTGAMALWVPESQSESRAFDWPGQANLIVDELCSWKNEYNIMICVLEKVHARPKQGVTSMFTFGKNTGIWEGILAALAIPYIEVSPAKWQTETVDKLAGKDIKKASLNTARRLFPYMDLHLEKHSGRADALLMAAYGARIYKLK